MERINIGTDDMPFWIEMSEEYKKWMKDDIDKSPYNRWGLIGEGIPYGTKMTQPINIKYIRQPYRSKKCGQACLAMILDRPVDEVCKELNKYRTTDLFKDVAEKLIREGYKVNKVRKGTAFEDVPDNSVLRIQFPSGNGHFVIKYNGKYYDPATGIVEDYKDTYRTVTAYFTFKKIKDD